MKKSNKIIIAFLCAVLSFVLASCSPAPRRQLSQAERQADMKWLITKIEANYAPIQYKEKLHEIDFESLKKEYLAKAEKEQTNEEFYLLVKKLVAEFKDGHMSVNFTRANLPGRASIAYLGFQGQRKGENYRITEFFPTFTSTTNYPLQVNDEIISINGVKLPKLIKEELLAYRNVGHEEANITNLMSSLFARSSLEYPLPEIGSNATLHVKRNNKEFTVDVPWIVKDFADFQQELETAVKEKALASGVDYENKKQKAVSLMEMTAHHPFITKSFVRNLLTSHTTLEELSDTLLSNLSELSIYNTFEYQGANGVHETIDFFKAIESKFLTNNKEMAKTPLEQLKEKRHVPLNHYPIASAKTFPAYVALIEKGGKRHAVGYIRVDTFSPEGVEPLVLKEVKQTLKAFRDFGANGVDKLVIDLVDNGGGSLSLGLQMAQLLSSEKLDMPSLEVKLNDSWMDSFEKAAIEGPNDAKKEIARRSFQKLLERFEDGNEMSSRFSVNSMYPFQMEANEEIKIFNKEFSFDVILITNEMCASMCDIFSAILKDNGIARIIGEKTMGAGGNVVNHGSAPNSGFTVRLTESLILSPEGEYLENKGVEPDIKMPPHANSDLNYQSLINMAFEEAIKEKQEKIYLQISSH